MLLLLSTFGNAQQTLSSDDEVYSGISVVKSLPKSWSINEAPDGKILVPHREGGITIYDKQWNGKFVEFTPADLYIEGQGGLLDIEFHPQYLNNGWIYLSYAAGSDNANRLKVVRFVLSPNQNQVSQLEDILILNEDRDTPVHFGGRLAFMSDNSLLISSGDGFDYRERAQLKTSQQGKILRVSDSGEPLPDNPYFSAQAPVASKIYSLGHRNPQSLLVLANDLVVSNEHGPAGGDEINIIDKGVNYGWPVVTNGMDYIGATISPFKDYPGMQLPSYDWTPSIAPTGMAFLPALNSQKTTGTLLVTSIKFKQLHALTFDGLQVSDERVVFKSEHRLRDVMVSKSRDIFVLTDSEPAMIIKLVKDSAD